MAMTLLYIMEFHYIDLKHICQNLNQFGYGKGTKHGGCSEYTIIPAKFAYLLQTDIDDAQAAILERKMNPVTLFFILLFFSLWCCSSSCRIN